jgi:methyl-accepting chemotaxis protein
MKDLSKDFERAYGALGRLDNTLQEARGYAKGDEAKGYLEEARKASEEAARELRETEERLGSLSGKVESMSTEADEIGSRTGPLFERANNLIDSLRKKGVIPLIGGNLSWNEHIFFIA